MKLEHGTPREIEGESMRIIGQELEAMGIVLPAGCEAVVKRAIHTTADFDYARNLCFTPGAVEAGVAALRAGTALVTDTNMALSGVNRGACEQLGVERFCYMADPQVAERARTEHTTRAAAAVDRWAVDHPAGIFDSRSHRTQLVRNKMPAPHLFLHSRKHRHHGTHRLPVRFRSHGCRRAVHLLHAALRPPARRKLFSV